MPAYNTGRLFVRMVSDHSPLLLQFSLPHTVQNIRRSWKLNPFWLNIIDQDHVRSELADFFIRNRGSTAIGTEWEAMKEFIRGILIQQISRVKFKRGQLEKSLREGLSAAEARYVSE